MTTATFRAALRAVALILPILSLVVLKLPTLVSAEEVSSSAEQAIDETETVTILITPNRFPTEPEKVGSSVSVVTAEEIERKKIPSVIEALRTIPSVAVAQNGGPGKAASVFIRGGESDHTLVLIDGIRVNENNTGQYNFGNLKAENIERIEVIRGPQSVLYGSEAIGGVINILTKRAKNGFKPSFSAEAGSYGTQHYKATAAWGSQSSHTSTTVSFYRTDGISAAAGNRGNPEGDSYENFSLSTGNGTSFLGDGRIDVSARYTRGETELDGFEFGIGATDDPNAIQDTESYAANLSISKPLLPWLTPSVILGATQEHIEGKDPDTEFNNFDIKDQNFSVLTKFDVDVADTSILTVGHSFENRKGENKGTFDESRDIHSVFVQAQQSWNDVLFFTAGVRHDDDSDFGEETTYRTTAAYLLNDPGTRIHTSFGTAFKAPSFNELAFPDFGNPNLEAETSWGYDVGVEQRFLDDRGKIDVTFFHNRTKDLITFDSVTFLAVNVDETEALGFETTIDYSFLENLHSALTYTYTDSEDRSTGDILPRRPRHSASLSVFANPIERLDLALTVLLVNSRRESDGNKMDDYERVDVAAGYEVTPSVRAFTRIENLFDEDYEEVVGFGTKGFSVFAGVEIAS